MSKKQNKKGFSLIELGIVIAVIVLLLVGIISSASLISSAKMVSVMRKIDSVNKAIGEFNVVFQKDGIKLGMGSFQKCLDNEKYFKNSITNFCRAMYCDEVDTANKKTANACGVAEQNYSQPQSYWATEMLQVLGYIPSSKSKIQTSGLYRATHVVNSLFTAGSIPGLSSLALTAGRLVDGGSYVAAGNLKTTGWQNIFSPIDSDNVVMIGYTEDSAWYNGTYNTILSNAYINNTGTSNGAIDGYKYLITFASKAPSQATFTVSEAQGFDQKYDDGKPGSGRMHGGRIEGSTTKCKDSGGAKNCYNANNVSAGSSADYGGMGGSEVGACFNLGNYTKSYQPFGLTGVADALGAEYTNVAAKVFAGPTTLTGTDVSAAQRSRAKSDRTYGCNMVYVSNYKWND